MSSSDKTAHPNISVLPKIVSSFVSNAKLMGLSPIYAGILAGMMDDIGRIQTWEDLETELFHKLKKTPQRDWTLFVQQASLGLIGEGSDGRR